MQRLKDDKLNMIRYVERVVRPSYRARNPHASLLEVTDKTYLRIMKNCYTDMLHITIIDKILANMAPLIVELSAKKKEKIKRKLEECEAQHERRVRRIVVHAESKDEEVAVQHALIVTSDPLLVSGEWQNVPPPVLPVVVGVSESLRRLSIDAMADDGLFSVIQATATPSYDELMGLTSPAWGASDID